MILLAHALLNDYYKMLLSEKRKQNNKGDNQMNTTRTSKTIIIISIILLLGGAMAFAHGGFGGGNGYGRHMRGYGGHMMGPDYGSGFGPHMRDYGPWSDMSEEDRAKFDNRRETFFEETRELRGKIDENRIALRDEMIKDNPDEGKVLELQKQISMMQAEFDQKAIKHRLEVRKLLPEDFQGHGFRRGGGRGPGNCW